MFPAVSANQPRSSKSEFGLTHQPDRRGEVRTENVRLSAGGAVRQLQFRAGAEPLSVCPRCCRLHSGQAFTDVPPVRDAVMRAGAALFHSFLTLFSLYDSLRLLVHPGRSPRARYNNNRRQTSCTSASRHAAANGRAALVAVAALHQ